MTFALPRYLVGAGAPATWRCAIGTATLTIAAWP